MASEKNNMDHVDPCHAMPCHKGKERKGKKEQSHETIEKDIHVTHHQGDSFFFLVPPPHGGHCACSHGEDKTQDQENKMDHERNRDENMHAWVPPRCMRSQGIFAFVPCHATLSHVQMPSTITRPCFRRPGEAAKHPNQKPTKQTSAQTTMRLLRRGSWKPFQLCKRQRRNHLHPYVGSWTHVLERNEGMQSKLFFWEIVHSSNFNRCCSCTNVDES